MDDSTGDSGLNTTGIWNQTLLLHIHETEICNTPSSRNTTVAEYVACLIASVTIVENCVILGAIFRGNRSVRKPPYWFIANLAVADALTGLGVILAVFLPIGSGPSSRIGLKGFAVVTFIVSINSLLFVSFDRYIRIVRHSDYKKFLSRKKILAMIVVCWMFSLFVFLILPLVGWSCGRYHCCAYDGLCVCMRSQHGDDICGSSCSQSFVPFTKKYLLIGVLYFTISVAAMTAFYTVIFRVVKKKTFSENKSQFNKRREINLAKTLVLTLGIFVICWLPAVVIFIIDLAMREKSAGLAKAFDFALVLTVINSLLNPIIYSIRMPRMRATIRQLFVPCARHGSANATSWVSSTSNEKRSTRTFSIRRKSRRKGHPTSASSSSGLKDQIISKAGQQCDKCVT